MAEATGGVVVRASLIGLLQLLLSAGGSLAAVAMYQEHAKASVEAKVAIVEKQTAVLEQRASDGDRRLDDIKTSLRDLNSKIDTLIVRSLRERGPSGP